MGKMIVAARAETSCEMRPRRVEHCAGLRRVLLFGSVAVSTLSQSSGAWAQAAPSSPAPARAAPAPPKNDPNEITIVAETPERSSIDRTSYAVRDNVESRSANALDLLRQVPLVSVTPRDDVQLMGVSGVKILVDGKEVADQKSFLRNLQGSQIARIEVITNPSAQFSASGTGGIINIVLRRSFAAGLRGSVTGNADSYGRQEVKASPTWTGGRLSVSGGVDLQGYASHDEFDQDRYRIDPGGNPVPVSSERQVDRYLGDSISANALVSYKLTPKQTISISSAVYGNSTDGSGASSIALDEPIPLPERQITTNKSGYRGGEFSADYRKEGPREGETLTASANWSTWNPHDNRMFETADPVRGSSLFLATTSDASSEESLKIDYVRPSGDTRRLSLGAALDRTSEDKREEDAGEFPTDGRNFVASSLLHGWWLEAAAYATYQFPLPLPGVTALAGLRLEGRQYHFASDAALRSLNRDHAFPSLHLERKLSKRVTADLSYSRRIEWTDISNFDPALRFSDPTTAQAGNPLLRPEITDSYEGTLKVRLPKHSIDIVLFDRETHDALSSEADLNGDGVLIARPVNLGSRSLRGASLSIQGALGGRLRYSLSGNLADQRFDFGGLVANAAAVGPQYNASAQLDYRRGNEGRRGADHVTIDARYAGPTYNALYRASSRFILAGSWSHAFTDRLSGLAKIDGLLSSSTVRFAYFSATTVSREEYRFPYPRFTVSLTYDLAPHR